MPDLGTAWVARRELEIRARRPSWYEGFAYEGLTAPVVALSLPVAVVLIYGRIGGDLLSWLLIPYASYLFQASAGLTSGSIAVDRACLRRLPVSAWTLLSGKMLGALLNLLGELVVVLPLLTGLYARAAGQASQGLAVALFLAWQVCYGGLLGLVWTYEGFPARESARQARHNAASLIALMPMATLAAGLALLHFAPRIDLWAVAGVWLLHPIAGLFLLQYPDVHLLGGTVMCCVAAGLLSVLALGRLGRRLP